MKLQSFQIHHYGPLDETPRIHLQDFNLFWGHNEDGKTLTLEAIITLLHGKSVRRLNRAFLRVKELPVGFVEILLGEKVIRLEGKQSLAEMLKLPTELFLNLFVVRNSDLLIQEDHRFYGTVTEQLTHSRLSRIEHLIGVALQQAQLTPSGDQLRNTADNRKLRERVQLAETLIKRIQDLEIAAATEQWPELTRRIVDIRQKLEHLDNAITHQEQAQKRQKLEQGEQLLEEWHQVNTALHTLDAITPEVTQHWQAIETRIQQLETDLNELNRNIEKSETVLQNERHELDILQAEVDQQRQIRDQLQQDFLPNEKQFESLQETVAARQNWRTILFLLMGSTLLATLISLYITLTGNTPQALISLVVSLLIFLAELVAYLILITRPATQLKRLGRQLLQKALTLGLSGENEADVRLRVHQFLQQLATREKRLESRRAQVTAQEKQLSEYYSVRQQKQNELHKQRNQLSQLKQELDVATLLELNQRLKEKNTLEQRQAELSARLQQLLGTPTATEDAWRHALNQLEPFREQARHTDYNEHQLAALRQEKSRLEEELETLNLTLQRVRAELQEVEREARRILLDHEPPPICRSVFDLPSIRQQLQTFLQKTQQQMWLGQQLKSILEEALEEEQERISDLFGESSTVSRYFRELTQGLYTAVQFDTQENQLRVVQKGGQVLTPEQLSGGTFDQLYFAIRIALAERVLQGQPGFLLLDDPFIKADPQRLSLLMHLLFNLRERGWQILYFSAKAEILSALEPAIQSGHVNRISLPQPLYKKG